MKFGAQFVIVSPGTEKQLVANLFRSKAQAENTMIYLGVHGQIRRTKPVEVELEEL